jgi:predicted Zn-dependent protease
VPDADARSLAGIMGDELEGLLLIARRNRKAGLEVLARAAALEKARPRPIARPYPVKPAIELYGEALLSAGEPGRAVVEFKAALARTPNRPAALLGLARSAHAGGAAAEAAMAAQAFLACWHAADPGRNEIAEARRLAGDHP